MATTTIAAPAPPLPAAPKVASTAAPPVAPSRPSAPTRRRFTVAEYYAMAEAGIFSPEERVELLDGDVILMAALLNWHAYVVDWLNENLMLPLQGRAQVRVQNPTLLNDYSQPEPDVMLLRRRDDFYRSGHPAPADVLLLIEVSDSSLSLDRNQKLPRYAAAGIPEVWIVNRPDRRIEAYANPVGDEYADARHYGPGESIAPQAFPDIALDVDRIIADGDDDDNESD